MRTCEKLLSSLLLLTLLLGSMAWADAEPDTADAEPDTADAGPEVVDAGPEVADAGLEVADAGLEAEPKPKAESRPSEAAVVDETKFEDAEPPKAVLPYAKGDSEVALVFALAGSGEDFYLGVGPSYAYYVINRLAVGAYVQYTHIFSSTDYDYDYPESLAILPFLKFAILRSKSVSPYLIGMGGFQGEWGSRSASNGWVLGLGGGVHVGVGKNFAINIQLLALHTWYNDVKIYRYRDEDLTRDGYGNRRKCETPGCVADSSVTKDNLATVALPDTSGDGNPDLGLYNSESGYRCTDPESCKIVKDKNDVEREWLFPLITIGVTYFF